MNACKMLADIAARAGAEGAVPPAIPGSFFGAVNHLCHFFTDIDFLAPEGPNTPYQLNDPSSGACWSRPREGKSTEGLDAPSKDDPKYTSFLIAYEKFDSSNTYTVSWFCNTAHAAENKIGVSMMNLFCFTPQQVVTKNADMCTVLSTFINDDTVQYVIIYW